MSCNNIYVLFRTELFLNKLYFFHIVQGNLLQFSGCFSSSLQLSGLLGFHFMVTSAAG